MVSVPPLAGLIDFERTAERGDPVSHSDQAATVRIGTADAVVANPDVERSVGHGSSFDGKLQPLHHHVDADLKAAVSEGPRQDSVRQLAQLGIGPPRVVERLGNDRLRVSILVVESLLSEARRIRARPRAMGSVGRDLDERTRRIMTYLAEGPRMKFFAVEVDYFRAGDGPSVVLVPRTAFVPSWVAEPSPPAGSSSSAATISLTTCFSGSPNSPG